jgi:hypothetical protein
MNPLNRRTFIKTSVLAAGGAMISDRYNIESPKTSGFTPKAIMISKVSSNFEREPLLRPFGFKGGYMTEI